VTLVAVTATVLLALVDPDGHYSQRYELGRVLERGGDSSDLRIALVPNRCDAHAVAEDKRGTFIPFEVTSDAGPAGTYFVRVPDDEKASSMPSTPATARSTEPRALNGRGPRCASQKQAPRPSTNPPV